MRPRQGAGEHGPGDKQVLARWPSLGAHPAPVSRRHELGAVVAGVIGYKKFHYDIWEDTVNTASHMESHGVPGTIQIARPIYELLKDDFICEPRG